MIINTDGSCAFCGAHVGETLYGKCCTLQAINSPYENPLCTGNTLTCPDMECSSCGIRECLDKEPLHFHHDGCPARCGT